MKTSNWGQQTLTKNQNGALPIKNAYRLKIVNTGSFVVYANNTSIGDLAISPGLENALIFDAHPSAPVPEININFEFNANAESADAVVITYTTLHHG